MATRKNKPSMKDVRVYIVRDKSGTILKIVPTIQLARKYAPENGSITNMSLATMKEDVSKGYFSEYLAIVEEYLKREAMRKK
jgi:hypothetical protein